MSRVPLLALAFSLITTVIGAQSQPTADALGRSLQRRYQSIRDFSADFVHSYRGGVLRKEVAERGVVAIKKPGMMRWNYTAPERKTFISDGKKLYSYIPEDHQVIVSNLPPDSDAPAPVLFLAGKGDVTRDFTASYADASKPGAYALKLVPRQPEGDYASIVLLLDPRTLQIRALTTFDLQGGESTFTFSKMKENQGLTDKEFVFRIPRGVEIVTDDSVSR